MGWRWKTAGVFATGGAERCPGEQKLAASAAPAGVATPALSCAPRSLVDVMRSQGRINADSYHGAKRRDNQCSTSSSTSPRSEEHPSELQSLMRLSYDVFCLKKKTNN